MQLGLPYWFFQGAGFVLLVCLPIIVATAAVQGGRGTPSLLPVRRWFTWRRAVTAGTVTLFALLGVGVTGYMGMRLLGIGPIGTLIGQRAVLQERDRIILADFREPYF